jgi:hypothetical protein
MIVDIARSSFVKTFLMPYILVPGLTFSTMLTNGCQTPAQNNVRSAPRATLVALQVPDAPQTVTVTAAVRVNQGRVLLQAFEAWQRDDIDHARLFFFRGADATPRTFDVNKANLSSAIRFNNLVRNTGYRVEVRAWADAAESEQIDNFASDPSSCTTTFATTDVAEMTLGSGISLKLRDRVFAGRASSSIGITDGEVVDTSEPEFISF